LDDEALEGAYRDMVDGRHEGTRLKDSECLAVDAAAAIGQQKVRCEEFGDGGLRYG